MPTGTKVESCYQKLVSEGKSKGSAAAICQSSTGESLHTGNPLKSAARGGSLLDKLGSVFAMKKEPAKLQRSVGPVRFSSHGELQKYIADNPTESFPKEMYADWLEEHGGMPFTAELIRRAVGGMHEVPPEIAGRMNVIWPHWISARTNDGPFVFVRFHHHADIGPAAAINVWSSGRHVQGGEAKIASYFTKDPKFLEAVMSEHNPDVRGEMMPNEQAIRQFAERRNRYDADHPTQPPAEPEQLQAKPKMSGTLYVPPAQGARMLQRLEHVAKMMRSGMPIKFTTHQDFVKSIGNSPGDSFPKLMYADWLEEHGSPALAELIRLNVEGKDPQQISHNYENIGNCGAAHSSISPDGKPAVSASLTHIAHEYPHATITVHGAFMKPTGLQYFNILSHSTLNLPLVRGVMEEQGAAPEGLAKIDEHIKRQQEYHQRVMGQPAKEPEQGPEQLSRLVMRLERCFSGEPLKFASDVPPAPGTAPIPSGHVRLFHYSRALPEVLRREGLKFSHAKGHTYSEPNLIWGSTQPPDLHHIIVEYHVPANDPDLSHMANYPRAGENLEEFQKHNMHVGMTRDIRPEEIIAIHEPWHHRYRYIQENPEVLTNVLAGHHDSLLTNPEYGPAIAKVKAESFKNKRQMQRSDQPVKFAEPPLRAKPLRSGLVELPFGGGLLSKSIKAPEPKKEPMQTATQAVNSLTGVVPPQPASRIARGPFTGTPDERKEGDAPRYRMTGTSGHPLPTAPAAMAEGNSFKKALIGAGVPVAHPVYGPEVYQRHVEAAANVLRTKLGYPEVEAYLQATRDPQHMAFGDLDQASRGLVSQIKASHPWLGMYNRLAEHDAAKRRPQAQPVVDLSDPGTHAESPAVQQALEPDFAPPTIPPAQDLPPLKPALLPGELSRKVGRGGRIGTLEELHAGNASREQMTEAIMRKFLLTPQQARRTVGNFLKRKARSQHLWRGFQDIIRMRRG